uniref:Uncharacterized protein n=1 Tax=Rhizophora mucronata TaxID=61149 RepID=A0A2P2QCM7_RHIMU
MVCSRYLLHEYTQIFLSRQAIYASSNIQKAALFV